MQEMLLRGNFRRNKTSGAPTEEMDSRKLRETIGRIKNVQEGESACARRRVRHGLIKSSFVPPVPLRELRDLLRYRRKLVEWWSLRPPNVRSQIGALAASPEGVTRGNLPERMKALQHHLPKSARNSAP